MKRPPSHTKEDTSEIELKRIFSSAGWIVRKKPKEYGIDYEIEIVKDELVTGKVVWVQLKSRSNLKIKNNVLFSCKVKFLKYALECDIPVLLVIHDIKSGKTYWICVQDYILDYFKKDDSWKKQKTITLKIPLTNVASQSLDTIDRLAHSGVQKILEKKLLIFNDVIKGPSPLSKIQKGGREWDKLKIYDRMNGWSGVSEAEIVQWFQGTSIQEGTVIKSSTPVGEFELFTPIAPDLLKCLDEMVSYGMLERTINYSSFMPTSSLSKAKVIIMELDDFDWSLGINPLPPASLIDGGPVFEDKLKILTKEGWKTVPLYPELIYQCRNIGRPPKHSLSDAEKHDGDYKYYLKDESPTNKRIV